MNLQVLDVTVVPNGQVNITFNRTPVSTKKLVCNTPNDLKPFALPPRLKGFLTECLDEGLLQQVAFDDCSLRLPVTIPANSDSTAIIVALKSFVDLLASFSSTLSPFAGLTVSYIARRHRFFEEELPTPIEQAVQCLLVPSK